MYHTKYLLVDQWTDQNFTKRAEVKKMELKQNNFLIRTFLQKKFSLSLSAVGVRIMINVPT